MSISEMLSNLRKLYGLSYAEAEKEIGVPADSLEAIERGAGPTDKEHLKILIAVSYPVKKK